MNVNSQIHFFDILKNISHGRFRKSTQNKKLKEKIQNNIFKIHCLVLPNAQIQHPSGLYKSRYQTSQSIENPRHSPNMNDCTDVTVRMLGETEVIHLTPIPAEKASFPGYYKKVILVHRRNSHKKKVPNLQCGKRTP